MILFIPKSKYTKFVRLCRKLRLTFRYESLGNSFHYQVNGPLLDIKYLANELDAKSYPLDYFIKLSKLSPSLSHFEQTEYV